MWFEMKPDLYGGDNCDEIIPQWECSTDGDIGSDIEKEPLIFKAKNFPPGTKIIVSQPVCPKCGDLYEDCIVRTQPYHCDFDWKQWFKNKYS